MPVISPDAAWGHVITHYGNGVQQHTSLLHIGPVTIPPGSAAFPWVTPGITASVAAMLYAVLHDVFVELFPSPWSVLGFDVFQNHGTSPATLVGSGTTAAITGGAANPSVLSGQLTYNFRSALGNPAKLVLLDGSALDWHKRSLAGLDAAEVAMVTALESDTNVLAHDGSRIFSFRDRTLTLNRRLRRHYGLS
jgi:hypothetical protein